MIGLKVIFAQTQCLTLVLEKCLDFAPIQGKIDEPKLSKDFNEFCRRMRIKWNFRNESLQHFSETLLLE